MVPTPSRVEQLESRVLFALVHAELHRPPTALLAAGDVNGDSIPDIVEARKESTDLRGLLGERPGSSVWRVTQHLGRGDGTFAAPGPDDDCDLVLDNPVSLNLADVDGDRHADIVLTDNTRAGVRLIALPTDGKGHVRRDPATGAALVRSLDVPGLAHAATAISADTDGDGVGELAVFGFEPQPITASAGRAAAGPGGGPMAGKAVIFDLLPATGRFGPRQSTSLDGTRALSAIVYDDLDDDGAADFAVADDSTGRLVIWSPRSNLLKTHTNPLYQDKGLSGTNPLYEGRMAGSGDLDGDGTVDLIAAVGPDVYYTSVARDGTLRPPTRAVVGGDTALPPDASYQVGDFDADGLPDLVAAADDAGLFLATNTSQPSPDGTPAKLVSLRWRQTNGPIRWMPPESLRVADFDRDGRDDLLTELRPPDGSAHEAAPRTTFAVLLSRTDAKLNTFFERGEKPTQDQRVATGDLDRDGDADIASLELVPLPVSPNGVKEDVYVWKVKTRLSNGDGTFAPAADRTLGYDPRFTAPADGSLAPFDPINIAIGDLDADGLADTVITAREAGSGLATGRREAGSGIATGRRQYALILPGTGNGDLGEPDTRRTIVFPHVLEARGLAIGDVDGDGAADLVVSGPGVKPSTGPATGGTQIAFLTLRNNIIHRDLAFRTSVLSLTASGSDPDAGCGDSLAVTGDLDGDGHADLLAMKEYQTAQDQLKGKPRNLVVLLGDGAGGFAPTVLTNPFDPSARRLSQVGDVDRDGDLDLLAVDGDSVLISSFDRKTLTFLPPDPCKVDGAPAAGLSASRLLLADFTGDGRPDLLAFSPTGRSLGTNTSSPGYPAFSFKPIADSPLADLLA